MPPLDWKKNWEEALGFDLPTGEETVEVDQDVEDASYDASQVVKIASTDLNMLAGLAMPLDFTFLFPIVLRTVWQLLLQYIKIPKGVVRIALGIPRGFAKTTLVKLFILYCILFTDRKFIIVISDVADKAENIIADVVDMLAQRNIYTLFGQWNAAIETKTQALKKFTFRGRPIVLAAIGAGGSIRGLNIKNVRPDVMIFEDIQTRECAESKVQSDALMRWFVATAMKARSPIRCMMLFVANMYPGPNSILKKLKANPNWIKFISGAILADGQSLWEELHPINDLLEEFNDDIALGHPELFLSEKMNDTEVAINSNVDISAIPMWPYGPHELPQAKVVIIDPATGKEGRDDVAIGLVEIFDERPALMEVIEERLDPGNQIRRALLMALKSNARVIAVEGTAYQSTLLYWFGVVCEQIGLTGFHFVEIPSTSKSKNFRILEALKSLAAGNILVHDRIRTKVVKQIADWNPLKRNNVDNILDILGYATKVTELYGHLMLTDTQIYSLESGADVGVEEWNHAF